MTTAEIDLDNLDALDDSNENFVALRNKLKETARENKDLRAFKETAEPRLRETTLKEVGIDPTTDENGEFTSPQAKAVLKLHGDGEFTAEALKATAETYGIPLGGGGEGDGEGGAGAAELTPAQQQAIDSTQRGQQLAATSTPSEPQSLDAQIAEAQAAGDVQRSLALKNQKLAQASAR